LKKFRISILFPGISKKPVGGYKIIYKYLTLLKKQEQDLDINIFYSDINFLLRNKRTLKEKLKIVYYSFNKKFYKWSCIKDVDIKHSLYINQKILSNSDIIIATSVETAIYIKRTNLDKNKKVLYFIQGFEDWNVSKEEVLKTYHYGFKNIVVSSWLKSILKKSNAPISLHLPNPTDEHFICLKPLKNRDKKSILFMFHEDNNKGSKEALEAFKKLYNIDNRFKFSCFSTFNKPNNFPKFIDFYKNPKKSKLVELYNTHFFFVSASYKEGFGLTPAEAMACGACVISTKSGGVDDFAIDNKTALMIKSPPIPNEIVNSILKLSENEDLMLKLSKNGIKTIKRFNWEDNIKKIIDLLQNKV